MKSNNRILPWLIALALACAGVVFAQTYTAQTERAAFVGLHATWTEGQTAPDTVRVHASLTKRLQNNADASDAETRRALLEFDGLRTDRSFTPIGGGSMTYRTATLNFLLAAKHARDNP